MFEIFTLIGILTEYVVPVVCLIYIIQMRNIIFEYIERNTEKEDKKVSEKGRNSNE